MPKQLTDCVKSVQKDIDAGRLPKGSSAWAICVSRLRKAGTIKKNPKGSAHQWGLAAKKAQAKSKRIRRGKA